MFTNRFQDRCTPQKVTETDGGMSTLARVLLNTCLLNNKFQSFTKMGRNKFHGGNKRKFDKPRDQKGQGYKFQEGSKDSNNELPPSG